jgi:hypothetical protein
MSATDAGQAFYLAEMETEHYSWRALGHTEDQARDAIEQAWIAHHEALNLGPSDYDYVVTPDDLNDYYGVRVTQLEVGSGYRDESKLT